MLEKRLTDEKCLYVVLCTVIELSGMDVMFVFRFKILPLMIVHTSFCNTRRCFTFTISLQDVDKHYRVGLLTESNQGSFALIQLISNFSLMLEWKVK